MLSFPSSPRSGQSYAAPSGQIYVFDGIKWIGTAISGGGSSAWADITDKPSFFSGSYEDLTGKPDLAGTYQFYVAADDSTQRLISSDELIKISGSGTVATSSDGEGNITITGSGITASSSDTFTNKTINIAAGQGNTFQIQGNSISSISGSGSTLALTSYPTFTGLNIGNGANLTVDGGTGSYYWAGQTGVPVAGIDKAGVYRSSLSSTSSLFTFGANGTGTMSAAIEGSLFIGTSMPSNNGGLNTNYAGWLVVQAGGKFGGDINTLGNFILDSSSRYVQFGDGSMQYSAYTGTADLAKNISSESDVSITVNLTDSAKKIWQFGEDGNAVFPGDLVVNNLTVNGTSTTINTQSYTVADNIMQIADGNVANSIDVGFVAHRTVGATLEHTGFVRDASDNKWILFNGLTTQPGNTIDFTGVTLDTLQLGTLEASSIVSPSNTLDISGIITTSSGYRDIKLDPRNDNIAYIKIPTWDDGSERLVISNQLTGSNGIYFYLEGSNTFRFVGNQFIFPDNSVQTTAFTGWNNAGNITFPDSSTQTTAYTGTADLAKNISSENDVSITVNLTDSTKRIWNFGEDGILTLPGGTAAVTGLPNYMLLQTNDSQSTGVEITTADVDPTQNGINIYTREAGGGRVTITTNGGEWQFKNDGSFTAPGRISASNLKLQDKVAVGDTAGLTNQGYAATAVGLQTAYLNQGSLATAVGADAGAQDQSIRAVAVGAESGYYQQGQGAVALGYAAGSTGQGAYSIAIGYSAGIVNQAANSIILCANGNLLNGAAAGFYVDPIRSTANGTPLMYNSTTKELFYSTVLEFVGSKISTSDSSGLTVDVLTTFNTDIVAENDITVAQRLNVNGNIKFSDNTIQTTAYTGLSLTTTGSSGAATLVGNVLNIPQYSGGGGSGTVLEETFESKTTATGVVTHDCTTNRLFYHTSITANFTANFTNLGLAAGEATSVTLVLVQGGTARMCNAVQIAGAAQTILWQGSASAPSGNASRTEAVTFSVLCTATDTYTVLGMMTSFGGV